MQRNVYALGAGDLPVSEALKGSAATASAGDGSPGLGGSDDEPVSLRARRAGKRFRRAEAGIGSRTSEAGDLAASQSRAVLLRALGECHPYLEEHSTEVAVLAEAVAVRLGMDGERQEEVRVAAELHDVGKMPLPREILAKPCGLTRTERMEVERHTVIGERILAAAPALAAVAGIVRASHEWADGRGYPDRLSGKEIPPAARVIGVCDAYDAMVSDRPYRPAMDREAAVAELRRCSGFQFDADVVEVVCSLVSEGREPRVTS